MLGTQDMIGSFVVVCTDKDRRGVFGGTLKAFDGEKKEAVLADARMCVMWGQATRGVLGLASGGPGNDCRITASVPEIAIDGVSCVMRATDAAADRWRAQPWS